MLGAGVARFLRARLPMSRRERLSFVLWVGLLLVIYVPALFGPSPPTGEAAAYSGFGLWLIVLWAFRLDRAPAGLLGPAARMACPRRNTRHVGIHRPAIMIR